MAAFLDQILLEDIAKNCPQQFISFQQCMSNTGGDIRPCLDLQKNLAACIKTEVPALQRIQTDCKDKLLGYESCLKKNMGDVQQCADGLTELRECATGTFSKEELNGAFNTLK
ncbi:hypothetical protein BABINDRAFT_38966 [Babjeviella inositovora NRRL Y-12698]|uniref:IMS import disulfide relay-system CHCH-CHCH-like Cx9C domain-containing protein n=1 Tax=Babjeviella inositovora NRRL Y-12698 TaxID=984486 RepID=A0A1E3QNW1_9ASCO|nr:uncharacterized protein BABINDRAFT_38966 [Babjeviella inositovora NRRL Y-12698]ODQ78667.1 hypothetical protein BABINDRAFT_38966 [Babjeviella inositovora NRRL Y-12698]